MKTIEREERELDILVNELALNESIPWPEKHDFIQKCRMIAMNKRFKLVEALNYTGEDLKKEAKRRWNIDGSIE